MTSAEIGKIGEQVAAEYYVKQGYVLVERNFKVREGEIDLVLQKDKQLVFAEVKTRKENSIAQPKEWVTPAKQQKIIKAALHYLAKSGKNDMFARFDVVEVIYSKGKNSYNINCIENAFST